uniref:Uncharacterized protein n=1 Tax=Anguilla anguilla TaxID=7936 RepID=A0A0E9XPX5_ANGAN
MPHLFYIETECQLKRPAEKTCHAQENTYPTAQNCECEKPELSLVKYDR